MQAAKTRGNSFLSAKNYADAVSSYSGLGLWALCVCVHLSPHHPPPSHCLSVALPLSMYTIFALVLEGLWPRADFPWFARSIGRTHARTRARARARTHARTHAHTHTRTHTHRRLTDCGGTDTAYSYYDTRIHIHKSLCVRVYMCSCIPVFVCVCVSVCLCVCVSVYAQICTHTHILHQRR